MNIAIGLSSSLLRPLGGFPADPIPHDAPATIAIGDIHGCSAALDALLDAIRPRPEDTIVTLGDYINRGPDSRGVLDRLIDLGRRCRLVPLLGNHDQMLLEARSGQLPD